MDDALVSKSLAYRKHEPEILAGRPPPKYLRILPYILGTNILELGSAEGVLAMLLAKAGKHVTALERRQERHDAAQRLRSAWGMEFGGPRFVCGDVVDSLDLLKGKDTLLCVRVIYYFGEHLDTVFAAAAKHVPNVVLCGNKNRAQWWRDGVPNRNDRADNYYASHEGMIDLLTRHGYRIKTVIEEGDPIVVGAR